MFQIGIDMAEKLTKTKSRAFVMVLYPQEDPTHFEAIERIVEKGYDYCAIDHDKDVYDTYDTEDDAKIGQPKKIHTHLYLRFKSARYIEPLARELGIAPNYIQKCHDTRGTLGYFVHDGYPGKYQYTPFDVYGPLKEEVAKACVSDNEGSKVLEILDLLDTMPKPCTYRQFLVAICKANLYGHFRRMGSGVNKLLDEHNGLCNVYDF